MATFSTLAEVASSGQFSDYMRYMDRNEQGRFRLMTKEYKQGRSINMPTVSRADVTSMTPKLRSDNTNGRSVFLRPVDRRWVLLDLDDSGYDDFDSIPIIGFGTCTAEYPKYCHKFAYCDYIIFSVLR